MTITTQNSTSLLVTTTERPFHLLPTPLKFRQLSKSDQRLMEDDSRNDLYIINPHTYMPMRIRDFALLEDANPLRSEQGWTAQHRDQQGRTTTLLRLIRSRNKLRGQGDKLAYEVGMLVE